MTAFLTRPRPPSRFRLTNGRIVTPTRVLDRHDLVIVDERIAAIEPTPPEGPAAVAEQVIDAAGAYLVPGLIDIHADYIEHMAAPRPTALLDFRFALREAERELVTHGITTMFHSLALYARDEFAPSPIRTPDHTRRLIGLIDESHHVEHLIRHRCHARFEIDNLARVDELAEYIRSGRIHLLSFMDHTPGQGQYRDLEVFRNTLKGYRKLSDADVDRVVAESQARAKLDGDAIGALIELATRHGIAVASHDDDSLERVDAVRALGATVSEFPITLEVARHARAVGMHTVAGAPNVVLGGSHSGNLSAAEAVATGVVDVLCSDYYPAALLKSLFLLHTDHGVDLPAAIRLATLNAACAVRIETEVGSLEVGKRADLLAVRILSDGSPAVVRAFVDGVPVHTTEYRR